VTKGIIKYWVPHGCTVAGPNGSGFHPMGILETDVVMPFKISSVTKYQSTV